VQRLTSPTGGVLLVVAIVLVLVSSITAATLQRRDPAYEGSRALLIDQPRALAAAPSGDLIAKLATLRVKYVSLLKSDAVIQPAAEALGLPPAAVAAAVQGSAPPESLLILVTARSAEARPAAAIAEAVGASLTTYLTDEQARLGVKAEDQVTLTPLRAAGARQVEPTLNRSVSMALVSGFVIAGLVYLALGFAPAVTRGSSLFK
jgi:capsular polysaccharide biosynthesis protein